jgi:aconitate hydratase
MLVLAFALAGRMDIDLTSDPLSMDPNDQPVYLKDLWPTNDAIDSLVKQHVTQEAFIREYAEIFEGDEFWKELKVSESTTYNWEEKSTYIKNPPYFDNFTDIPAPPQDIIGARTFLLLGDTVTTDHISPAGAIPKEYPAGRYLIEQGIEPIHFNSYGSRRGNHEVMMRGTFGNIRIKNKMVAPKEGAYTIKLPENTEMYNYEAAMKYLEENTPLIVLGGKEYGTGSSRDWAAKGTNLLGIKAVIAESFERIHRNNLVGMGALPLVFKIGENVDSLGLDGTEIYSIEGLADITPGKALKVTVEKQDGNKFNFEVIARLDTEVDVTYFRHGGILPYVLRQMMKE